MTHFITHKLINQSINQSIDQSNNHNQVQEIVGVLAKKISATGAEFTPALAARTLFGLQVSEPSPLTSHLPPCLHHHVSPLTNPIPLASDPPVFTIIISPLSLTRALSFCCWTSSSLPFFLPSSLPSLLNSFLPCAFAGLHKYRQFDLRQCSSDPRVAHRRVRFRRSRVSARRGLGQAQGHEGPDVLRGHRARYGIQHTRSVPPSTVIYNPNSTHFPSLLTVISMVPCQYKTLKPSPPSLYFVFSNACRHQTPSAHYPH